MYQKSIMSLFFLFLLFEPHLLKGEDYKVDSIFENLFLLDDTLQIKTLKEQCWKLRSENPKVALQLGEKAYELIEAGNYREYKSGILNFLGVVYLKLGKLDSAYFFYQEALNQSEITSDSIEIGYAYNNLGDFYFDKASYTLALENVMYAYDVFSALDYKKGVAYCQNNIGEIYIKQNRLEKALEALNNALKLRKEAKDEKGISKTKLNIALVYAKQKNYNEALLLLRELLEKNHTIGYFKGKGAVLDGLSDIYFYKKKYDEALKYRKVALAISNEVSNKVGEITNYNKLGLVYTAMKKYSIAENSFLVANKLSKASGYFEHEMQSYKYLSNLKAKQNDFKAALVYKNKYIKLKEIIYSNISIGKLIDLETAYDKIKQEKKVLMLEQKVEAAKLTRYLLISSLLMFALLIIFLIHQYRNKKKANAVLRKLNDSKDMFFSILAHDLKGPVVNIKGMTSILNDNYKNFKTAQIEQIMSALNQAANNTHSLLIKLLEWSSATTGRTTYNPTTFMLINEVDNAIDLLLNSAKKKKIKLVKKIDAADIVYADKHMVSTIFRNLISNAIKFSYTGSEIIIYSKSKSRLIEIVVADFGVGMNNDEIDKILKIGYRHTKPGTNNEKGTGVGLTLCAELIKTNKGKIRIESKPEKGSKFIFSLPKPRKIFLEAAAL